MLRKFTISSLKNKKKLGNPQVIGKSTSMEKREVFFSVATSVKPAIDREWSVAVSKRTAVHYLGTTVY